MGRAGRATTVAVVVVGAVNTAAAAKAVSLQKPQQRKRPTSSHAFSIHLVESWTAHAQPT